MTGHDLKRFRSDMLLPQEQIARYLGVSQATIVRWEKEDIQLPRWIAYILASQREYARYCRWVRAKKEGLP